MENQENLEKFSIVQKALKHEKFLKYYGFQAAFLLFIVKNREKLKIYETLSKQESMENS